MRQSKQVDSILTGVSTIANRYNPSHRPKFAIELPPLPAEKIALKIPSL